MIARVPRELQALWDRVPRMLDCKGLCHTSCGPTPFSMLEGRIAEAESGRRFEVGDDLMCKYLTEDKKCSIYDVRPMMCRVWGAAEMLPCVYGCQPERFMTPMETFLLLEEIGRLSGESAGQALDNMVERLDPAQFKEWAEEQAKISGQVAKLDLAGGEIPIFHDAPQPE